MQEFCANIKEKTTNNEGIAVFRNGVIRCYIGNDDGSDDCNVTVKEFNARFTVTSIEYEVE